MGPPTNSCANSLLLLIMRPVLYRTAKARADLARARGKGSATFLVLSAAHPFNQMLSGRSNNRVHLQPQGE
jgi:hypothetical protein